jgi:catechol 2,3-dioxygenase-like lactoylglutathione lyase family enzyme
MSRSGVSESGVVRRQGEDALAISHGTTLTAVTLNSPDPSALARFYERLLGWKIGVEKDGWVTLPNPEGGIGLSFQTEAIYVRPVWPAQAGEQQMMMHLEIRVDDLETGCAHARKCGAIMADFQPQDDVRVHLDPDGHPFCLYIEEEKAGQVNGGTR